MTNEPVLWFTRVNSGSFIVHNATREHWSLRSVTCVGVIMTGLFYMLLLQIIAIITNSPVLFMVHTNKHSHNACILVCSSVCVAYTNTISGQVTVSRTYQHLSWMPAGVIDWGGGVFASCCRGSSCSLARAMDGRISAAAPLALADQLPLPMIVKRGWSDFPVRRAL